MIAACLREGLPEIAAFLTQRGLKPVGAQTPTHKTDAWGTQRDIVARKVGEIMANFLHRKEEKLSRQKQLEANPRAIIHFCKASTKLTVGHRAVLMGNGERYSPKAS